MLYPAVFRESVQRSAHLIADGWWWLRLGSYAGLHLLSGIYKCCVPKRSNCSQEIHSCNYSSLHSVWCTLWAEAPTSVPRQWTKVFACDEQDGEGHVTKAHWVYTKLEHSLKLDFCSYLANKAVGCGVWGGAAIRTFKSTFPPSSFALRLRTAKNETGTLLKKRFSYLQHGYKHHF